MNKNIWILIMGFFLFQACLDDEGNYSYSDLLPIEIDSSKMSNSYRITQLDYLVVDPEVKQGWFPALGIGDNRVYTPFIYGQFKPLFNSRI